MCNWQLKIKPTNPLIILFHNVHNDKEAIKLNPKRIRMFQVREFSVITSEYYNNGLWNQMKVKIEGNNDEWRTDEMSGLDQRS